MSITTPHLPGFTYPSKPISNITPFTYRDGYTYLELLEGMRQYITATIVPNVNENADNLVNSINTVLETIVASNEQTLNDIIDGVDAFETTVSTIVDSINNKSGSWGLQRIALTGDTAINVNPAWPTDHPIGFVVTQDSVGGRELSFGPNIVGSLAYSKNPNATVEFYLTPVGDGTWRITTSDNTSVNVKDYGAVGDGVTNDTAAINAALASAINTKRELFFPDGVYLSDGGHAISGLTARGFRMNMIGRVKRTNSSPRQSLFTLTNVNGARIGTIRTDGNAINNLYPSYVDQNLVPVDEGKHDVALYGCTDCTFDMIDSRNPSGDTLYIREHETSNLTFNTVSSVSDGNTGRNGVSIIAGKNIHFNTISSINTGHPSMPGGLDIEPNGPMDVTEYVSVNSLNVVTAGTAGLGLISTHGKVIRRVTISSAYVEKTVAAYAGASVDIRGVSFADVNVVHRQTQTVVPALYLDNADHVNLVIDSEGSGNPPSTIGFTALVSDFTVTGSLKNAPGVLLGIHLATRGVLDLTLKRPGASSALITASKDSSYLTFRGDWAKVDNMGSVAITGSSNISNWYLDGVDFTGWAADTRIKGGTSLQTIRKRDCPGLNRLPAAPNFDAWSRGDIVWNSAPTPGQPVGWVATSNGVGGIMRAS